MKLWMKVLVSGMMLLGMGVVGGCAAPDNSPAQNILLQQMLW